MTIWMLSTVVLGALCVLWVTQRADPSTLRVLATVHLYPWALLRTHSLPFSALRVTAFAQVADGWPSPGGDA